MKKPGSWIRNVALVVIVLIFYIVFWVSYEDFFDCNELGENLYYSFGISSIGWLLLGFYYFLLHIYENEIMRKYTVNDSPYVELMKERQSRKKRIVIISIIIAIITIIGAGIFFHSQNKYKEQLSSIISPIIEEDRYALSFSIHHFYSKDRYLDVELDDDYLSLTELGKQLYLQDGLGHKINLVYESFIVDVYGRVFEYNSINRGIPIKLHSNGETYQYGEYVKLGNIKSYDFELIFTNNSGAKIPYHFEYHEPEEKNVGAPFLGMSEKYAKNTILGKPTTIEDHASGWKSYKRYSYYNYGTYGQPLSGRLEFGYYFKGRNGEDEIHEAGDGIVVGGYYFDENGYFVNLDGEQ